MMQHFLAKLFTWDEDVSFSSLLVPFFPPIYCLSLNYAVGRISNFEYMHWLIQLECVYDGYTIYQVIWTLLLRFYLYTWQRYCWHRCRRRAYNTFKCTTVGYTNLPEMYYISYTSFHLSFIYIIWPPSGFKLYAVCKL